MSTNPVDAKELLLFLFFLQVLQMFKWGFFWAVVQIIHQMIHILFKKKGSFIFILEIVLFFTKGLP